MIENLIKADNTNELYFFYFAMAYGSRSSRFARQGLWFDAFKDSRKIKKNLKKTLECKPDFYDAYYGLGLYNYWSKVKAKFLGFFIGNKNKGISQIKLAISKGQFLQPNAMYGLLAIFIHQKQYKEALELSLKMHKKYANNPTLNYRIGRVYLEFNHWERAKTYFLKLFDILSNTEYHSTSFLIDCLFQLAKCEFYATNYQQSLNYCNEALQLEKKCVFSRERNGQYEKYPEIRINIRQLRKKLDKLLEPE
jgi:tetratricopeptide (TPR) repeat protein